MVKDGLPWLRREGALHTFDPWAGLTGTMMRSGETLVVRDIWADRIDGEPNPFLPLIPSMSPKYVAEIKRPATSSLFVPIKRGGEIFCTIELSRYRKRTPFGYAEKGLIDRLAAQYGTLVLDYVLDVKVRTATQTAHRKLFNMARVVASDESVDYRALVEAYPRLSGADVGAVFFQVNAEGPPGYRLVAWRGDVLRETVLEYFAPSPNSILGPDTDVVFPLEGAAGDRRLLGFRDRLAGLGAAERDFFVATLDAVQSYVVYPLHVMGEDLGAVLLASCRPRFWPYLHMSPALSLYNSLLKSFLLNERLAKRLSGVGRKIHNPGFYCLGALKTVLARGHAEALRDPEVLDVLQQLEKLFEDLHGQGRQLGWRTKKIRLHRWLHVFVNQRMADHPGIRIELDAPDASDGEVGECIVHANEEQLELVLENILSNSLRAIAERATVDRSEPGTIRIQSRVREGRVVLKMEDNGSPYPQVSGHGLPQVDSVVESLGGTVRRFRNPYRTFIRLPCTQETPKEDTP